MNTVQLKKHEMLKILATYTCKYNFFPQKSIIIFFKSKHVSLEGVHMRVSWSFFWSKIVTIIVVIIEVLSQLYFGVYYINSPFLYILGQTGQTSSIHVRSNLHISSSTCPNQLKRISLILSHIDATPKYTRYAHF